jgi:hypothetical protein
VYIEVDIVMGRLRVEHRWFLGSSSYTLMEVLVEEWVTAAFPIP